MTNQNSSVSLGLFRPFKLARAALVLLLVALTASACSKNNKEAPHESRSVDAKAAAAPDGARARPYADRALIITIDTALIVEQVEPSAKTIRDEVERAGGYVADSSTTGDEEERAVRLDVRIPVDKLPAFRAAVAKLGEIKTDSERVEDVTEQRADLKARLHNARIQERRIVELLGQKTSTLAEVIEAEKELARVRESVERLEAQERSLEGKISLATVRISLTTRGLAAWQTPIGSVQRAGSAGLRACAAIFVYAAMGIAAAGPTLVVIGLIVLLALLGGRAIGKRKKAARLSIAQSH